MFNINEVLELILDGNIDQARDKYLKYRMHKGAPAIYYAEWSKIGELLGLYQLAKEDIEKALSIDKSFNIDYLYQYVKLLLKLKIDLKKCIRILQKIIKIDPNHTKAKQSLIDIYTKLGWIKAIQQLDKLYPKKEKNNNIRVFNRSISINTIKQFNRLLGGRRDLYAVELLDNTGSKQIDLVESELTFSILEEHIKGTKTLYWFPIDKDLKINIIALDYYISPNQFDPLEDKGYLSELLSKSFWEAYYFLDSKGIPVVAESLSNYSIRMWIFLSPSCHFLYARKLTKKIIQLLPLTRPKVQIRPVLPTRPQSVHWIESPIAMPFGTDVYTGHKRQFLNKKSKQPIEDQIKFIERINMISPQNLRQKICINYIDIGLVYSTAQPTQSKNTIQSLNQLVNSCNIISYIFKKIRAGKILSRKEKVVLFYTVGLLDPTKELLHNILMPCPDYKYQNIQRQAQNLYPRPISCLKIRELLPEVSAMVSCSCIFDDKFLQEGRYPSPLLHIEPRLVPTKEDRYTAQFCTAKELAEQYINLKQQIEYLKDRQIELRNQLILALEKKHKKKIKIGNKILLWEEDSIKIINSK